MRGVLCLRLAQNPLEPLGGVFACACRKSEFKQLLWSSPVQLETSQKRCVVSRAASSVSTQLLGAV